MTKTQFQKQSKTIVDLVRKEVSKEISRLYKSGAIDFDGIEAGNFLVIKALVKVAFENALASIQPPSDSGKEIYENLKKF